ncbi:hypothetical protein SPH9361_01636 [Sphingobium sp. CECT 9361]|nr:hypothetical protein SPH9361_01636 [Sphingobium sp. CECT 9361]
MWRGDGSSQVATGVLGESAAPGASVEGVSSLSRSREDGRAGQQAGPTPATGAADQAPPPGEGFCVSRMIRAQGFRSGSAIFVRVFVSRCRNGVSRPRTSRLVSDT